MQTYLELWWELGSSWNLQLLREKEKEASERLWEKEASPGFLLALGMSLLPGRAGNVGLSTGIQCGNRAKQKWQTWLRTFSVSGKAGAIHESVPGLMEENQRYLSRQHWRLHCAHSCGLPSQSSCTQTGRSHSLCTAHRPGKYCHCLVQNRHFRKQKQHSRIPAACTQPGHH